MLAQLNDCVGGLLHLGPNVITFRTLLHLGPNVITFKTLLHLGQLLHLGLQQGSVRMVKSCDLGLENAALGLRPRAVFSRPRSQFFTIRTSQPANNIYVYILSAYL